MLGGERVDANEHNIHSTTTNQLCEKKGGNSQATVEWTIPKVQGFIAVVEAILTRVSGNHINV